jgi:hypothetical protein
MFRFLATLDEWLYRPALGILAELLNALRGLL